MTNSVYLNHLKNSYRTDTGKYIVAISQTSCYFLNETTNDLIDVLPAKGEENDYIDFFKKNSIKPEKEVFKKLVLSGVLRKEEKAGFSNFFLNLLSPDIQLIKPFVLEKIFRKMRLKHPGENFKKTLLSLLAIFFILNFFILSRSGVNAGGNGYALFALILLGSLIHELGHSFMMSINGLGARNIGLFFYLIYPSFYVNMSGIEKMRPLDKFLTNAAGFIFQSVYCLILLLLYLIIREKILLGAYLYSCLLMIFNLNPFIKTDGYWLYKDFIVSKKNSRVWISVNRVYLLAAFLFTIYFSWHLITGILPIIGKIIFFHKGEFGFRNIFMSYMGIMSIKAVMTKAREFLTETGIIGKQRNSYNSGELGLITNT